MSTDHTRIPDDLAPRTQYLLLDPATNSTQLPAMTSGSITELSGIGMVGREFVECVDQFETQGDLDPATLRVCVNSIDDLLARYESEVVFRLLHVLTARTRRSRGMGHYHLPIGRESEAVRLFEPLFDAVVSFKAVSDGLEHRWHLRDSETTTDWIPI